MQTDRLSDAAAVSVNALWAPLTALWTTFVAFTPTLLAVVLILAFGYALAAILRRLTAAVLRRIGFDEAGRRIGLRTALDRAGVAAAASDVVGTLVFWLFLLTALISAAETLGLRNVSQTIDALVRYLPNVIGAVVIVVAGLLVAHVVRDAVRGSTASLGVQYASALSAVVYAVLIVVVASLAVGQLRIETELFNRVVEIVLVAGGGALGLALGLGTRDIAKHLVAGTYARELFRPGMELSVDGEVGAVDEVGSLFTRLRAADGRSIYIPNGRLTDCVVREGGAGARGHGPGGAA